MTTQLFPENVRQRFIVLLPENIENRICNAFKEGRGQELVRPIQLSVGNDNGSDPTAYFIRRISNVYWIGPATLGVIGVMRNDKEETIGGYEVQIELNLQARKRYGEIQLSRRIR